MSKLLKYAGILIGVVVALILGAVLIVPMLFDPNDLKGTLIQQAERHTGRKLEIAGDLQLSLFPWVGVEVAGVRLANAEGFGGGAFASVAKASVRARLMPLLERRLEVDTLTLEGVELNLVRHKDGANNWAGLAGKGEAVGAPGKSEGATEAAAQGLSIGGIEMRDARLSWQDQASGQETRVAVSRLSTGAIAGGDPVEVHLELGVEGKAPQVRGQVRLDGSVQVDQRAGQVTVKGLKLAVEAEGEALQGGAAQGGAIELRLESDMKLLLAALGADVKVFGLEATRFELAAVLKQADLSTKVSFNAPILIDGKSGRFQADALALVLDAEGKSLQGGSAHAEFGGDLEVLAEALGAQIKAWQVRSKALVLKGDVRQPDLQSTFTLSSPISLDGASGRLEAPTLRLDAEARGPRLQGRTVKGQASAGVLYGLEDGALELRQLTAVAGDLNLSGDLRGRLGEMPAMAPAISGKLKLAEFNLRSFLSDWGIPLPPTSDPKALTRLAADLEFQSDGATTKASRLLVTLDDTQIKGSAAIQGATTRFDLDLNGIDVDRYRPADGPSPVLSERVAEARARGEAGEALLPPETIQTLRGLNLDGSLGIGHLTLRGLKADGVLMQLKAHGGRLESSTKVSRFYQGTFSGTTRLDVSGAQPQITAEKHLAGVQIGPLLHDAKGEDRLSGTLRFNSNVQTAGNTPSALKSNLDGRLDFGLTNGSVKGFNLAQMLREAKAKLSGSTVSPAPKQTDFSEVKGSATIQNGMLSNQDLEAKSPFLRIDGQGTVNIPQESLDYGVTATVVGSVKGQGGQGLEDLVGIPIPVHLSGPLADPQYKVDMERVVQELAKTKLKDAANAELQKQLQGGKSGGFGDQLKKALPGGIKLPF